jgi:hypothetical protein
MKIRNEKDLWADLRKAMLGRWTAQRHSDIDFGPGVPDVSFVMPESNGVTAWCELKVWFPKDKYYKIEHYTQYQKDWMMEQYRLGVPVSLLLDVQTEYYLFKGSDILAPGLVDISEYINYCCWRGTKLPGIYDAFCELVNKDGR